MSSELACRCGATTGHGPAPCSDCGELTCAFCCATGRWDGPVLIRTCRPCWERVVAESPDMHPRVLALGYRPKARPQFDLAAAVNAAAGGPR